MQFHPERARSSGEYLLAEGVKVNGPAFANVNITSLAEEMTPGVTAADAEFERDR